MYIDEIEDDFVVVENKVDPKPENKFEQNHLQFHQYHE